MANPVLDNGYASPTSIFETSTTQQHQLGVRGTLADRAFRYTRFLGGTALDPNLLVQSPPPVANHVTETGANTGTDTAGATRITLTLGATLAKQDYYKDGYCKIETSTLGIGQIFKLRGHDYVAASGVLTAELYDPVTTATTGTEQFALIANPWADPVVLVASGTAQTGIAVGVPLVSWAACATASVDTLGYLRTATGTWTQARYGWMQTWGPTSILTDGTDAVIGSGAIGGVTTAGTVGVAVETEVKQRVGIFMETNTTASLYYSVFLTIAP